MDGGRGEPMRDLRAANKTMAKKENRKGRAKKVHDMTAFAAAVLVLGTSGEPTLERVVRYEKATYRNGDVVCLLEIS